MLMTASELEATLADAARGRFPDPDWSLRVAPLCGPTAAVIAFTGCFVVSAPVSQQWVRNRLDDAGANPLHPRVLLALAEQLDTTVGENDAVLAADPSPTPPPVRLHPFEGEHPRVQRARRYRDDVHALTTPTGEGLLVLGRGLAGRWEMSIEVEPHAQEKGLGRALALAARHHLPTVDPVFAQVTPGNAASLRALLAAGYRPIAQEVLLPLRPNPRTAD